VSVASDIIVAVIGLLGVAETGFLVARSAVIAAVVGPGARVRLSAHIRSIFNAGVALGVLGAGFVLAINSRVAYQSLLWANAASALAVAALYLRLPRTAPSRTSGEERPGRGALRDLPYVFAAQLMGFLVLADKIVGIGIPLWVVSHTTAPRPLAVWLLLINTFLVVAFQVRTTRGINDVSDAVRFQRRAYLVVAAGCVLVGTTENLTPLAATMVLAAAVVLITFGELWGSAANWTLRYDLAPDTAQGQYGGVYTLGTALPVAAGPALVTALIDHWLLAGWVVLAALFAAATPLAMRANRWAIATRANT
jgi:hypothetical protein